MSKHSYKIGFIFLAIIFTNSALAKDEYTESNYEDVAVTHMSMDLVLDMEKKSFFGHVDLRIINKTNPDYLWLDTQGLNVELTDLQISEDGHIWKKVIAKMSKKHEMTGTALIIPITRRTTMVRIPYTTTSSSKGINWIAKDHTANGFPMVATQFEPINARSFVPCQDTPSNRITYDARIRLHSPVKNMRVLMAAMERTEEAENIYVFRMTKAIPPYLIALAAGMFDEVKISDRVSVFAEPLLIDEAALEFQKTEDMVQVGERIFGPYIWERFDILLMPLSSFYGGIGNPALTFIDSRVVRESRSLVNVIAREVSRSWTGNSTNNRDWNHFWLNGGFTLYGKRLILEEIYCKDFREMDILLGQQTLRDNILSLEQEGKDQLTALRLHLDRNFPPDNALTHVPYEKGFNFLYWLEKKFSQREFKRFLHLYLKRYAFKSVSTEIITKEIIGFFPLTFKDIIMIKEWLNGLGIPEAGLPTVKSASF